MAFRDIYSLAATNMHPNAMDEMEARLKPITESMHNMNFLLHETEEAYVRERLKNVILLHTMAQMHLQHRALAGKRYFSSNVQ